MLLAAVIAPGIAGTAIWIVIVLAVIALVFVAAKAFGLPIPPWVMEAFWIVVVAAVIIIAIKLVASMA